MNRLIEKLRWIGPAVNPSSGTMYGVKVIETLSADEERAAALFRALGNPARIRIVGELAERQACVTGDLVDVLPLAQSTVSQHLKVLKDAGIIRGEVEGDPCYCLDEETLRWLAGYCAAVLERLCCNEGEPAPVGGA